MSVVHAWPLPKAPQLLSMIYTIVSSLLLKVRSCTNHKYVAMHASTSVVFVADTAHLWLVTPTQLPSTQERSKFRKTFKCVNLKFMLYAWPQANQHTHSSL